MVSVFFTIFLAVWKEKRLLMEEDFVVFNPFSVAKVNASRSFGRLEMVVCNHDNALSSLNSRGYRSRQCLKTRPGEFTRLRFTGRCRF